jgi:integrase
MTLAEARSQTVRVLDAYKAEDTVRTKSLSKETLQSVFTDYVRAKNIIENNWRKYEQVLKTYGGPLWLKDLKSITHKDVLDQREQVASGAFITWHEKNTTPCPKAVGGPGQANKLIEYGSMLCTHVGLKDGKNPFKGINPYPGGVEREKVVIEPGLWPRIAKAMEHREFRERMLFWTAMLMGARGLGAVRLKWERMNLTEGYYTLTNDNIECAGWKPATSPAWNYPLDDWNLEMLRELHEWRKSDVWLFPSNQSKNEGKPLGEAALERIFDSLREDGVLPEEVTPYSIRYTRATYSELMFGNTLMTQRMLNHQSEWGKGQNIKGSRLAATPGYVRTLTDHVRPLVNQYARTLKQLCGYEPMSDETKQVFFGGGQLTIYQRHAYAAETGLHAFQVAEAPTP